MSDHWRLYVMHIVWYNALVMRCIMMLSEIITHIGVTRRPTSIELVLFNSVFDPVEYHVHCFRALFLDCVIDNAICYNVFSFELYGVLFVAHFIKCCACESAFFCINKNSTKFGFSHRRYHVFEYCCMTKKWASG
jgi:hypothetical protein